MQGENERCPKTEKRPLGPSEGQYFEEGTDRYRKMHRGISAIITKFVVDKKNQLDVTFCILYFSSNSCSTYFGQPCAHHQEVTTA